ncbi:WD repeat-containing protein 73 [Cololabis saira]|uniref:WD repeat-containing protein 73 n=1 Tax=Cololabis saira TaxID=129043 RepID=UPI002AD50271|nr:WD repeat-containing protein 73 [Cololabis saira]
MYSLSYKSDQFDQCGENIKMEQSECDDILDDWFIESLKTYKDLHVYQLEHPTQVIEWTSGRTICVAGYNSSKIEILELRLPLKLFADENKGLCPERDFKVVHGGFTEGPIRCLRHIPGTRCAVTNDGQSSDLQVWDLGGDDSDVIRRTGSIRGRTGPSETGSRIAARVSSPPEVLHGALSSSVQLTQLESGNSIYKLETESADVLSSLQFLNDTEFLAGCRNGSIYIADTRTPAVPQASPAPASSAGPVLWWTDASGPRASSGSVVRVSSSGQAVVSDLRNLDGAVCRAQLDVQTGHCKLDNVRVSWSPTLDDCISVSGFDGVVQIYSTALWSTELQKAQPMFQHRGHAVSSQADGGAPVSVTSHVWHAERPHTLLSAASDGSVHVWDWVDPDGSPAE